MSIYGFSILVSIVITILGIVLTPTLLHIMNTPAELIADSLLYLNVYFGGIFFVFIYNTGSSQLRVLEGSKRPLHYLIVCCVVNIVPDIIFVCVFQLGMLGVWGFRVVWMLFAVPQNPTMNMICYNYPISRILTALFFIVYYQVKMKRMVI